MHRKQTEEVRVFLVLLQKIAISSAYWAPPLTNVNILVTDIRYKGQRYLRHT